MHEVQLERPLRPDLERDARSLSREAFVAAHPQAALLLVAVSPESLKAGGMVQTPALPATSRELSIRRTLDATPEGAARKLDGRVLLLSKRPGNPFPDMVFVGRALNNDLVLLLETLSKVHGYFRLARDRGRWTFTDNASKNGSTVNDAPLVERVEVVLEDGDRIRLGLEIEATFLHPETLYARLRGAP